MTEHVYQHIARAVFDTPLFIREAEGAILTAIVRQRMAGEYLSDDEIRIRIERAQAAQGPRSGSLTFSQVRTVPVYGVIFPRANLMVAMSGGTTVGAIRGGIDEALHDEDIKSIVLEFDTPGGSAEGIEELASWIRSQRGQKPLVAVVNSMCCSAGYYLAAQCDEIVASPSSLTGSIGVFMEHTEFSKADEMAGVTTTIVRQPQAKHEINDSQPLTDVALAHLQQLTDDYYDQFVNAVAKGRGVSVSTVRDGYGQGRVLTAGRAKNQGLADRVDTLDNTVRRLQSGPGRSASMKPAAQAADDDTETITDPATGPSLTAPGSGLPFAQRLQLVSAEAQGLLDHARERVEMRSREGRSLSPGDRAGLLAVAGSLQQLAEHDDRAAMSDPPAPDPVTPRVSARVALEMVRLDFDFRQETASNG